MAAAYLIGKPVLASLPLWGLTLAQREVGLRRRSIKWLSGRNVVHQEKVVVLHSRNRARSASRRFWVLACGPRRFHERGAAGNRAPTGLSSGVGFGLGLGLGSGWVESGRSRTYLLVLCNPASCPSSSRCRYVGILAFRGF